MQNSQATRKRLEEGLKHHQNGEFELAEKIYKRVLEEDPENADVSHFLGLIAHQHKNFETAVKCIRQAILMDPARPTFHFNLGAAQLALGRKKAALASYQEAAALKPDWSEAHYNIGSLSSQTGNPESGKSALTQAISLNPKYAEAYSSLSATLNLLERPEEAKTSAEKAIGLNPALAEAWTNLGNAEDKLGDLSAAENAHRKSIEANSGYAPAYYNLGNTLADMWRQGEALQYFRRALDVEPGFDKAQDNLLLNLLYDPDATETSLFHESCRFESLLSIPKNQNIYQNEVHPERPLRIGYVSPDFRTHSCAYFLHSLFEHHDHSNFITFAYSNVNQPDEVSSRFQELADHWQDITEYSDEEAAQLITKDKIDILLDLAGRSKDHRLGIFRLKPAPVQINWLGYPATTGLKNMDYRITDAIADPPGRSEEYHTELLIRLPGGFHCYTPPALSPEPGPLPLDNNGYVTFGSFNNIAKISTSTIAAWTGILHQIPQSVLILKSQSLKNREAQENILRAFAARDVDPDRIKLTGWIPQSDNPLSAYNQIDIALDTFPYNGTTTTFEALWMGVPVITYTCERHSGRVGASILGTLNLDEFIAGTPEEYSKICVSLSRDPARLRSFRNRLRNQMQSSPLMDAPGFTEKFQQALRKTWQSWCATQI